MSSFKPRYYQTDCVDAFIRDAKRYPNKNLLGALPTGVGKSCIIAMVAKEVADRGGRVLVLHRSRELVAQNNAKFCEIDPKGLQRCGVYSAGLGIRQTGEQVTFAGVQSVYKRAEEFGRIDLVFCDEAHQIPFDENSQYQQLIRGLRQINPDCKFMGVTATPYRTNGVIHGSKRSLFDRMSYVAPLSRMFEDGYLTKPVTLPTKSVDLSGVKVTAGEFNKAEQQSKFLSYWAQEQKTREILATANEHGRKSIAVFCSGVAHAELVTHELKSLGEDAAVITGETLPLIRATQLERFKSGDLRWIVNVDCLTTGWDAPRCDAVVVARGTQSAGLFAQIVGRGTRLFEGKKECHIIDFGGNIERFGPIDSDTYGEGFIKDPSDGTGQPPTRCCPKCFAIFAAGKRVCPECGLNLPEKEKTMIATKAEITVKTTRRTVVHESYKEWTPKDENKLPTLRVQYKLATDDDNLLQGGMKRWASEWLCINHKGYAREKFCSWWKERSHTHPPETIGEAMEIISAGGLAKTLEIDIRPDGKFDRIVKHYVGEKPAKDDIEELPF